MEEKQDCTDIHKKPYFYWTIDFVSEFARQVAVQYKNSEIWSGDFSCEKNMANQFIKRKKFEEIYNKLIISDAGQTLIVDKYVLEELIRFLDEYKEQ